VTSARPDTRFLYVAENGFVTSAQRVSPGTSNLTAQLSADDGSSATLMSLTPAVGHYMAFGQSAYTFSRLDIEITTNGVGTWTVTWQYWDGSAWTNLSGVADGSTGFTAGTGVKIVTFTVPADWAQTTIGGLAAFYVRAYISSFTSLTTRPAADYAKTYRFDDLSQYNTPLTSLPSGGYEDGVARTALDGTGNGRSLEVSVELDTGSDGVIVGRGVSIAACTWGIGLVGSVVAFIAGGAALTTLTPPNLDGSLKTYIIAWSTEPNPGGSGATAMRSECLVQDVDGNSLTYTALTHAVTAEDPSDPFAVGGLWSGVALDNAFTDTINAVRVSGRFHTRAETREHFYAQTVAPDPDGIVCVEQPVWPDDGHVAGSIVGPQLQASALAMAIGQNRHRLAGPTIQVLTPSSPEYQPTLSSTTDLDATRCFTLSDTYKMHTGWTWRRKIPRQCEWVRVQVQIATWDTGAAAIAVNLRCYCSDKPPHLATEWSVQTLTRTANDTNGSGTGALLTFSPLFVRRNGEGRSFFWIASSLGTNDRVVIREISFAAMSMPDTDAMPPNQWGG
jgi:hypothetical protein